MDKIKVCDFLSFVLAIWLGVVSYNFYTFQKETKSNMVKLDSSMAVVSHESDVNKASLDSLKSNQAVFAKSILYLDSCQANKTMKADRAEKRGRFLGGLIKGLFPGM